MDERVRFVGRLLDGEKMVALCREFAISRKTNRVGVRAYHTPTLLSLHVDEMCYG